MRTQDMKKKLEDFKTRVGEAKMGLVPFLVVDSDLHLVVNPAFEAEGRKYGDLDEKLVEAERAVAMAFDEGTAACDRLGVSLDSPPDPLSSLEWQRQIHQSNARVLVEARSENLRRRMIEASSIEPEESPAEKEEFQRKHGEHVEKAKVMREAAKGVEEFYHRAEEALKGVNEALEALSQKHVEAPSFG